MAVDPEVLRFAEFVALAGYGLYERLRTRKVVQAQQAAQAKVVIDHVSEIERQVSPDPESTQPGQTVRELLQSEALANRSFRTEIRGLVQGLTVRVEAGEADEVTARGERAELLARVVVLEAAVVAFQTMVDDVKKRLTRLEPKDLPEVASA